MDEDEDKGEVIKEGFDKWGYVFWYNNYHPVGGKRKKNYDTSPYMKVELKKCSIHDYKHCADVGENVRKRLKDGKLWGKDDYDLTLWGNRGGGRAKLVAYRRRMAVRDLRSDSLSILRVVQNKRLVSFLIKNSYRCARCIPYTQLTVSESR